jgi:hypothetical protein
MALKIRINERNFGVYDFKDHYGHGCSLQKSSLATENCIWLGVDDAAPEVNRGKGWEKVELPLGTVCHSRMHLTRKQVSDLLPILIRFAKTGNIKPRIRRRK